jgi:hypothetical protein
MWHSSVDGREAISADREHTVLAQPDDPALETAYWVAGGLMEVLGPLFWAVLIVGFLFAEFWLD